MSPQQHDPNGFRHGCTYKQRCDNEATTTVVMNGRARAVCESCRSHELREQSVKRDRMARREESA